MNYVDSTTLLNSIKKGINSCKTEEDVKLLIAPILDKTAEELGIERAEYESTIGGEREIFKRKKTDALYGRFIVEYKSPNLLADDKKWQSAIKQVEDYITGKSEKDNLNKPLYFACIIDGYNVSFVRYSSLESRWVVRKPSILSSTDITRIIEAIRGLQRKALDAGEIIKDLGPGSSIAKNFVRILFETNLKSDRSKIMFEEWFRTFLQVVAYDQGRLKELNVVYGMKASNINDQKKLLFSVQTYFAIIMKLISAEVVQMQFGGGLARSYLAELDSSLGTEDGINRVKDLEEEGGFFQKITGIRNYLEGDFFSWYVDEWNDGIFQSFKDVTQVLANYEPGTSDLEPERIRDLFKLLYENLLPKKLRHSFGEYYTPDWLADLVVEKVGLNKDGRIMEKRVLDPACGSGTFIVAVIRQLKFYREEHNIDSNKVFNKIITDVVGYDLNPIAVLAARSNYIIALGELIKGHAGEFEIPIYMADSLTRRFITIDSGTVYSLDTAAGNFSVAKCIVDSGSVNDILNFMKEKVNIEMKKQDFEKALKNRFGKELEEDNALGRTVELYVKLLNLEREGRDKIWINILKNSFAPLLKGKFDYVIGNPPWINWESLPNQYRESSKDMWRTYGLLANGKSKGTALGRVKKDLAMLFIVYSLKVYAKVEGTLGMLCPYTLFKVTAGSGFRGSIREYKIKEITDMVEMKPFEGATTRTSLIIIENVKDETKFPIFSELWRPNKSFSDRSTLQQVRDKTSIHRLQFFPSNQAHPNEPWLALTGEAYLGLKRAIGRAGYEAHAGVYTGLNGAYWVKILQERKSEVFVSNISNVGKIKVPKIEGWVERDLIYPLARGRDLTLFRGVPSEHIIIPHKADGKAIPLDEMKSKFPKSYTYFQKLEKNLRSRAIYKLWGKNAPFYSVFDIGKYTYLPYKVSWQYISGEISGKGRLNAGIISDMDGKTIIPNEKLMSISVNNEGEAFYILGLLSSSIAKLIVASYSIESHISTDILTKVNIHTFDPKDPSHLTIAKITKEILETSSEKSEDLYDSMMKELNKKVAELYGITDDELAEIETNLKLLLNEIEPSVEGEDDDNLSGDEE